MGQLYELDSSSVRPGCRKDVVSIKEARGSILLINLLCETMPPKYSTKLRRASAPSLQDNPVEAFKILYDTASFFLEKEFRVNSDALRWPTFSEFESDDEPVERVLLLLIVIIAVHQHNQHKYAFEHMR